jgi:acetyl-CoA carboxylase biotin carboxyl carrier protein
VELDFDELRQLLAVFSQTEITELTLKHKDFELTVRKEGRGDRSSMIDPGTVAVPAPLLPQVQAVVPPPLPVSPVPSAPTPSPLANDRLVDITSPMVGTFYRSPAPDEPPFVDVGDRIRLGQTVCIVEAMKLMNELEAEVAGEIVEILVQNSQPVEYGQVLMRVNPT